MRADISNVTSSRFTNANHHHHHVTGSQRFCQYTPFQISSLVKRYPMRYAGLSLDVSRQRGSSLESGVCNKSAQFSMLKCVSTVANRCALVTWQILQVIGFAPLQKLV